MDKLGVDFVTGSPFPAGVIGLVGEDWTRSKLNDHLTAALGRLCRHAALPSIVIQAYQWIDRLSVATYNAYTRHIYLPTYTYVN